MIIIHLFQHLQAFQGAPLSPRGLATSTTGCAPRKSPSPGQSRAAASTAPLHTLLPTQHNSCITGSALLQHTAVDMQTGLVDGGRLALAEALPQAEAGRQALRRRRGARAAVPERGRRGRGCWRRGDPLTLQPRLSSVSMPACITSQQLLMSPSMAVVAALAGGAFGAPGL